MLKTQGNLLHEQAAHQKLAAKRTAELKSVFIRCVDDLISPDEAIRKTAHQMLKASGERAVDVMVESLVTRDPQHQWRLLPILGEIGTEKALRAVATCLYSDTSAIVAAAAQVLGRSGSPIGAESLLARIARTNDEASATWIIGAVGELRDRRSIPHLIRILHETQNSTVRYTAIEALGKIGDRRVLPDIFRYIDDGSHHVRDKVQAAIEALTAR